MVKEKIFARSALVSVFDLFVTALLQQPPPRDRHNVAACSSKNGDRNPVKLQNKRAANQGADEEDESILCDPPGELSPDLG
jgi:hypothetical protein